jgi:hypothetical protein
MCIIYTSCLDCRLATRLLGGVWRRGEMAAEQMEEAASSHAHDIVTGRDAEDGKGLYGSTPARKSKGSEIHPRPACVMPCVAIQPHLAKTR